MIAVAATGHIVVRAQEAQLLGWSVRHRTDHIDRCGHEDARRSVAVGHHFDQAVLDDRHQIPHLTCCRFVAVTFVADQRNDGHDEDNDDREDAVDEDASLAWTQREPVRSGHGTSSGVHRKAIGAAAPTERHRAEPRGGCDPAK